jgi:hypothetical protein
MIKNKFYWFKNNFYFVLFFKMQNEPKIMKKKLYFGFHVNVLYYPFEKKV